MLEPCTKKVDDVVKIRTTVLALFAVATLASVAACGSGSDEKANGTHHKSTAPAKSASPTPSRSAVPPAANAGGLCAKLSYEQVETALGERFDVAAADGPENQTQSCVLRTSARDYPRFILSRHPTQMSAEDFRRDFQPEGAAELAELGLAAYSQVLPPDQGSGARPQIDWLTADAVYTARWIPGPQVTNEAAQQTIAKLAQLGRLVAG